MISVEQIIAILTTITTAISTIVAILQNKLKQKEIQAHEITKSEAERLSIINNNLECRKYENDIEKQKLQNKIKELEEEIKKLQVKTKVAEDKIKIAEIVKENKK